MNNIRRLQIKRIIQLIEQAQSILDEVFDDEQAAFDNMPDNFQQSSKGEQIEDNLDNIQNAMDLIEDVRDILSNIE